MKKTYINPALKVVKIQPARLLNESMGFRGDYDKDAVTIGARRGRFSRWEEEEYFEE